MGDKGSKGRNRLQDPVLTHTTNQSQSDARETLEGPTADARKRGSHGAP